MHTIIIIYWSMSSLEYSSCNCVAHIFSARVWSLDFPVHLFLNPSFLLGFLALNPTSHC